MYNVPCKEYHQPHLRVVVLTPLLTSEINVDFVLLSMAMVPFLGCIKEKHF